MAELEIETTEVKHSKQKTDELLTVLLNKTIIDTPPATK